MKYNEYKSMT